MKGMAAQGHSIVANRDDVPFAACFRNRGRPAAGASLRRRMNLLACARDTTNCRPRLREEPRLRRDERCVEERRDHRDDQKAPRAGDYLNQKPRVRGEHWVSMRRLSVRISSNIYNIHPIGIRCQLTHAGSHARERASPGTAATSPADSVWAKYMIRLRSGSTESAL